MPSTKLTPALAGVGSQTVRLRDIPLDVRLHALTIASRDAKTESEALHMLRLVLDPGDAGGRIAA